MPVFKVYFKVMRASAVTLAISLVVFMGLAVLFSFVAPGSSIDLFEPARIPLTVINRDGGAPLAQGLADYLSKNGKPVSIPDDREKLQDALFFRRVEYIAIIPPGFSEDFMAGHDPVIRKIIVPDSISSRYLDLSIDRFLNTVRLYRVFGGVGSQSELVAAATADLAHDTPVTVKTIGRAGGYNQGYHYYFAYFAYALLAMIITGISSIMIAFNRPDLYLRNLSAPLPRRSMNLQIAAGHGAFALGCWGLLLMGSLVLHGKSLFPSGLIGLYALNTLAFASVCTGIGFLAGSFVRSRGAQAGVINATALGMSFLGGVFVPQSVMSKPVLAAARFLPSYWYIRANDIIGGLSKLTAESLNPIFGCILVQLGFAVALFSVTLFFSREGRR